MNICEIYIVVYYFASNFIQNKKQTFDKVKQKLIVVVK